MNREVSRPLISEIALRCADIQFKDFDYNIYEQALLRADREVAKKYQIIQKVYSESIQTETETELNLPNFKAEYLVTAGDLTLRKVTHKIETSMENCYFLEEVDGKLVFAYKLTNIIYNTEEAFNELQDALLSEIQTDSGTSNQITILYTTIPNAEAYNTDDYVINEIYDEERISSAVIYLAKLGIVKFSGDKKVKYSDLLKLTFTNDDYDKRKIKDNAWISIRPFNYI